MNRRRQLPPKRVCPGCGTEHYAYREGAPCAACAREAGEDQSALVAVLRERRAARRERLG